MASYAHFHTYEALMLSERGNQKMYSDASLFGVSFSMNITK